MLAEFHLTSGTQLLMAGHFDPKVFVTAYKIISSCKQLTKTFGLKRPAIEYYQQLCIAH